MTGGDDASGLGLSTEKREKIGIEDDPLLGYETALGRNLEAAWAEQRGDTGKAVQLYEASVAEDFVGVSPYGRLATLHEQHWSYAEALRVAESYVRLARSGRLPRRSQHSADRKLPEFEARIERYQGLLGK